MEDVTKYPSLALRGRTFYLRAPVPLDIQQTFKRAEVWKSLRTQDRKRLLIDSDRGARRWWRCSRPMDAIRRASWNPPLAELSDAQLQLIEDAHFVHLLVEDEDILR